MDRLRARKAAAGEEMARPAPRFEPTPGAAPPPGADAAAPPTPPAAPAPPAGPQPEAPADDFAARLLKAKRKVWEERNKDPGGG
jgi:hypothetical protein